MRLETGICCVNYDDFLAITLPNNCRLLSSITIITAPWDHETIAVATRCGAKLLITEAWTERGPFNKGRALNEWVHQVGPSAPELWLLSLDADVWLHPDRRLSLEKLDPMCLYSAKRRMCPDRESFQNFCSGVRALSSFPIDIPPVLNGMVWGAQTANPAGLYGCFQLWCPNLSEGMKVFPETGTAAEYDVEFALSFSSARRIYLDDFEVLHLGISNVNWSGRTSSRW